MTPSLLFCNNDDFPVPALIFEMEVWVSSKGASLFNIILITYGLGNYNFSSLIIKTILIMTCMLFEFLKAKKIIMAGLFYTIVYWHRATYKHRSRASLLA